MDRHRKGVLISAKDPSDVLILRQRVIEYFEAAMRDEELLVPYSKQGLRGEIYTQARVLSETYDEQGARLLVQRDRVN